MRLLGLLAVAVALIAAVPATAGAIGLQPLGGSGHPLEFDEPIYVTSDPGDSGRLFVVERRGTIRSVQGGESTLFADLTAAVGCEGSCQGERGLLSIAPAPDFHNSGRLYVDYADDQTGAIHVEELTAEGPEFETADESRLREVIEIDHPDAANHNGGQIAFGPGGYLFISTGDGGGADDQFHNAQNPESLLGKILRVDPKPGGGYEVPSNNPFRLRPAPYDTIWSLGLRNPYRFSFDRLTHDLTIGDVGQGAREEVDFAPALNLGRAANYGWNCREGGLPGPATDPQCPLASYTDPVFDYSHAPDPVNGVNRCSIIGGYVVRDPSLGALAGRYLYSDYCSGTIRALQLPASADGAASGDCPTGLSVDNPVSFGEDSAGRVYVVSQDGGVYRVVGPPSPDCPAPAAPTPAAPVVPTVTPPTPRAYTLVGIKPQHRKVPKGRRGLITAYVSPCSDRRGHRVRLLRNGHRNGSRRLDLACTAHFRPRIARKASFRAEFVPNRAFLGVASRQVRLRPVRVRHRGHHHHDRGR